MIEVTRYDLTEDVITGLIDITPVPRNMEGRYVAYEDFAAIKVALDALAAENAALQKQCDAQPVKRPKNIGPSYAAVALSTRDEQWYDAIAEAGYEVQE